MTFYYQTNSWSSQPQPMKKPLNLMETCSRKRKTGVLFNYQTVFIKPEYLDPKNKKDSWIDATRRETIEGAEQAIDSSIRTL